jgi:hypothetical protein
MQNGKRLFERRKFPTPILCAPGLGTGRHSSSPTAKDELGFVQVSLETKTVSLVVP